MRNRERVLTTGDRVAMALFIVIGAGIAVTSISMAVVRIVELVSAPSLAIDVELVDTPAPVKADGETISLLLGSGTMTVNGLPARGVIAGVLGQVAFALTISGLVACLIALTVRIMRGTVFGRVNTRLVMSAAILGLVGVPASRLFDGMLADTAMMHVSGGSADAVLFTVEPFPYLLAAFAAAVVGTVFVVGERLQRDTEGLV